MDSLAVVLENSSSFLYVPPGLELFLHVLFLEYQILSPETLQLSYSSILVAFFSKNGSIVEYAQHNIQKKKRYVDFHKDVSHRACKKYVSMDFQVEFTRTYK